jgi:hypothetical protein
MNVEMERKGEGERVGRVLDEGKSGRLARYSMRAGLSVGRWEEELKS